MKPDLTLFFDITVENAIRRMAERQETGDGKNRMDAETADFYASVRDAYLKVAEREPGRFKVLDANGSIEETHARVVEIVTEFLG